MKTFQLVSNFDGSRSELFTCSDNQELASFLSSSLDKNKQLSDFYVLVIAEKTIDGEVVFSREPMLLVSSVVSRFSEKAPF